MDHVKAATRVVTATEARTHLGELMRAVEAHRHVVVVERAGKAKVVMLSVTEYQRLKQLDAGGGPDWLKLVSQSRERIRSELKGKPLPASEEILRGDREERDADDNGLH